jgi:hypothetical protein
MNCVLILGQRHSINPGKFNKKEHMLITSKSATHTRRNSGLIRALVMATVAFNTPYTSDIIVSQVLPQVSNP